MRIILLGCCLLIMVSLTKGQDKKKINADFDNFPFPAFVERVEALTGVHFYFNPSELDSLKITIKENSISLQDLLSKVFANTSFNYSIDRSDNVFVFNKRSVILTDLPLSSGEKLRNDTAIAIVDPPVDLPRQTLQSSIENKLFEIGTRTTNLSGKATLAGYVRDARNGEPLAGASVYTDSLAIGAITDQFGYFSLTLGKGRHILNISSSGMKSTKRQIFLSADGKLNVEMYDDVPTLKAVVVISERNSNIRRMQMGIERLSIKVMKKVPVLLGETDILRVVLTLPGVTSVGEASTGFQVRGGSADQNLILYNDATIYNPSHLFGFFSAFNPDVVKSVELYKSSIPEKYGGRLSSVLDVTAKNGNSKKISGTGGIGLLTSRLTIEGPIVKDKTSFVVGGRTTYSNWLLKEIPNVQYQNSKASFYDIDLHLNHTINQKNNLFLSAYTSNDQFRLNNDTTYKYGNRNIVLKWKHIFNNKLYASFTGGLDHYQYNVSGERNTINAFKLGFSIDQANFRADASYTANYRHSFEFGLNSVRYKLKPGTYESLGASLVKEDRVPTEQGLESAIYAGHRFNISSKVSLNSGIRYSLYNYLGPQDVYQFIPGVPRETTSISDTLNYEKGKFINTYHGPEVRLALRYSINDSSSIKLSYNTLRQYIHLLSNTAAISPTDVWKLSDPNIRPQLGEQFSIGFYRNFRSNTIEASLEFYFKRMKQFLDYKSGATLLLNHHIETDVINTRGKLTEENFSLKRCRVNLMAGLDTLTRRPD